MKTEIFEHYDALLSVAANHLANEEGIPVDLKRVRTKLGLGGKTDHRPYNHARLLRSKDGKSHSVLIPRELVSNPRSRGYARYLIAHEIGHYILDLEGLTQPHSKREYYVHEELCDRFAWRLLIPDKLITEEIHAGDSSALVIMRHSYHLCKEADTNWCTAASRLTDVHPSTIFIQMTCSTKYGPDAYEVNFSSAPRKKGLSAKIPKNSAFVRALIESGPELSQLPVELVHSSFPFLRDAYQCVSYSPRNDKWRFAINAEQLISNAAIESTAL